MKRLLLALLVVALSAVPLALWGQVGAPVNTPPGSVWTFLGPTFGASWVFPPQLQFAWVPHNAALVALVTSAPQVYRAGFYAPGDGGAAIYTKSAAACSLAGGVGDNGSQVKAAEGGCWLLSPNAAEMDFRVWGAKVGTNVDAPLQKALDWACGSHIPILAPYVGTTPYFLNSAITVGNGSATQNSTCTGVTLKGNHPYPDGTPQNGNVQVFKWNGGSGIIPLNAQGPATTINFINIGIDCNFICATAFRMHNIMQGEYAWLGVYNNVGGPAFIIDSEPVNNWFGAMEASHFHDITMINPGTGASGMLIGSASAGNCSSSAAVINNVFDRITIDYDGNTAGTYGIKLRLATQLTFRQTISLPLAGTGASGRSVIIEPPAGSFCAQFPTDIKFDHSIMVDAQVNGSWVPSSGGIHFEHWSTVYGPFPTASQQTGYIWGTDSKGFSFPSGDWLPGDLSGAGLAITVTGAKFLRSGGLCTVSFDLTYPTTSNNTTARIGTLPLPGCLPQFTATSVVGAPFIYTDLGQPVSLVCDNSGQCGFYNNQTSVAYTNAALSGKNFRFTATFIIQPPI